jgi:hypothetical protein
VVRRIAAINGSYCIGTCYGKSGYGYLKKTANGFNNAAKGTPFIVLCDLEDECAPSLITNWLIKPKHPNLIFRVAVREVEAWLLADAEGISSYLGVSQSKVPGNVDNIEDPKGGIIELAKRSRKPQLRLGIVPIAGSSAQVGPDYNGLLSVFVKTKWNIDRACSNSNSLRRAVKAITSFVPTY